MRSLRVLLCLCLLLCAACGAQPAHSPSGTPTPLQIFTPPASPTATGPDVEQLQVLQTGIGWFDLVTYPVAVVKNESTDHTAVGVIATFTTSLNGRNFASTLQSYSVDIPPQATVALDADCTDGCNEATATQATVAATSWGAADLAPLLTVAGVSIQCSHCGGHGYANVLGTVTGLGLPAQEPLVVFSECESGTAIVGGGFIQVAWSHAGGSQAVTVPVIISATPTACQLFPLLSQ